MRRIVIIAAVLASLAGAAFAQRFFGGGAGNESAVRNIRYDGRFTFVRLKYETAPGGYWAGGRPSWVHGFPLSEFNLMKIMNEVSYLGAHTEESNVLSLDDPELFKYPVAYIIEVSWWTLTDRHAAALREYIQKGGFVIVDDFKAKGDFGSPGWDVFEANMQRVLPGARFVDMQSAHPIFHCFFEIETLANFPQAYNAGAPSLYACGKFAS